MRRVYSSEPLNRFTYHGLAEGGAIVYLRDNIEKVTVESDDGIYEEWAADEVETLTDLPLDQVEESFDALWVKGETESKIVESRLANIEELLDATMAVVLGEE